MNDPVHQQIHCPPTHQLTVLLISQSLAGTTFPASGVMGGGRGETRPGRKFALRRHREGITPYRLI